MRLRTDSRGRIVLGAAGFWAFLLPVPLLVAALVALAGGSPGRALVAAAAFLIGEAAALAIRRGIAASAQADRTGFGAGRAVILKSAGCAGLGLATLLAAGGVAGYAVGGAAALGLVAAGGAALAYGPAGRRAQTAASFAEAEAAIAGDVAEEAGRELAAIRRARFRIREPAMARRVDGLVEWAGRIVAEIERDPGDVALARRFLFVYLDGARRVTERYAELSAVGAAAESEPRTAALLDEMATTFEQEFRRLTANDHSRLETDIAVLERRLAETGLAEAPEPVSLDPARPPGA